MAHAYQTPLTPRMGRGKVPPIAGYSGFVPSLISGNKHGQSWRNLFVDPKKIASSGEFSFSQPASPTRHAKGQEADGGGSLSWRYERVSQADSISTTESARARMPLALPNDFLPKVEKFNKGPLAGYGGFVPGYLSGNLHGAPWKDLISPRVTPSSSRENPNGPQAGGGYSPLATPRSERGSRPESGLPTPRLQMPAERFDSSVGQVQVDADPASLSPGRRASHAQALTPRLGAPGAVLGFKSSRVGTPRSAMLTPRSSAGTASTKTASKSGSVSARELLHVAQAMARTEERQMTRSLKALPMRLADRPPSQERSPNRPDLSNITAVA